MDAELPAAHPEVRVRLPDQFLPYLGAVAVRFQSQSGDAAVRVEGDELVITGAAASEAAIRKGVTQIAYREKIYAETFPMREALLRTVLR